MNELLESISIFNWILIATALILLSITILSLVKKTDWHPMLSHIMRFYTIIFSIRFFIGSIPYYELRDIIGRIIFFYSGYFHISIEDPTFRFIFYIQPILMFSAMVLAYVGLHNIKSKLPLKKKYINNLLCFGLSFVLFLFVILWPILYTQTDDYLWEMVW